MFDYRQTQARRNSSFPWARNHNVGYIRTHQLYLWKSMFAPERLQWSSCTVEWCCSWGHHWIRIWLNNIEKKIEKKGTIEKRKYDWRNVAKVHTQRIPLRYRATIHCTTRTALASLSFGRYSCLLGFLWPLISRSSLLAVSWRRRFGLFLRWYSITDPGAEKSGIRAFKLTSVIIFPYLLLVVVVVAFWRWMIMNNNE